MEKIEASIEKQIIDFVASNNLTEGKDEMLSVALNKSLSEVRKGILEIIADGNAIDGITKSGFSIVSNKKTIIAYNLGTYK